MSEPRGEQKHGEQKGEQTFLESIEQAAGDASRVLDLTLARFGAETGTLHELGADGLLHLKAWAGAFRKSCCR